MQALVEPFDFPKSKKGESTLPFAFLSFLG